VISSKVEIFVFASMTNDGDTLTFIPTDVASKTWNGYTLVYASVSIGNVGQLCAELLLSNLKNDVQKVAFIEDDAVLPMIGRKVSRDGQSQLCHALEVYVCEGKKLVILQQRAPLVKGRIPSFRKKLISWMKLSGFTTTYTLSSVSSHIRMDEDLQGAQFRFLCTSSGLRDDFINNQQWMEYSCKKVYPDGQERYTLPGSGIVRSLFEQCKEEDIPFVSLLMFCSPGNNSHEALQLLTYFNQVFGVLSGDQMKKLQHPLSMRQSNDQVPQGYLY